MSLTALRRYLLAGLLVWVPLVITLWVLNLILSTLDGTIHILPNAYRPDLWLLRTLSPYIPWLANKNSIPGFGALLTLSVLLITGIIAANYMGRGLLRAWERLLARIPVVKSIYTSVKQVSDTLFASNGQAFRKAMLVPYPRQGSWTIAFQTGTPGGEIKAKLGAEMISVFVPTTPNPTSGFFLILPRAEAIELDMNVDEALKYIISMGVVGPENLPHSPVETAVE